MVIALSLIILLGLAPSFVWLLFYLREDEHPEPKRLVLYTFLSGAAITIPVLVVQYFTDTFLNFSGYSSYSVVAIILFATIEELFKYFAAFLAVSRRREFDEPIDAMIYMVAASLGFAAVENIASVARFFDGQVLSIESVETVTLRFVGATLLHTISSGIVGYYWGHAMASGSPARPEIYKGLALAVLVHAVFNYFILTTGAVLPVIFLVGAAFFLLADFEKLKISKTEDHLSP